MPVKDKDLVINSESDKWYYAVRNRGDKLPFHH